MAKAGERLNAQFETKPGGPEFRLSNVDGRATVDVGQPAKFGGKLGPGWRAEKWGGRGWMTVCGHDVKLNKAGEIKTDSKRGEVYECECVRKVKGRDRAERHIILPGSTEYQIVWDTLADVPDTGYVDLVLEFSEDLTWHKQLPATQQMLDMGVIQPEGVANSHAVYGTREGRYLRADGTQIVNYETGKFCHVMCSRLVDARGNSLWLDQTAPLSGPNRLRSFLDMEWISGATFPVTLDPTFGYTSAGASNVIRAYLTAHGQHSPASNGNATSISKYNGSPGVGNEMTLGIYSDSSGSPSSLLRDTNGITDSQGGVWNTANLDSSLAITSGTNYWLAVMFNSYGYVYVDTVSSKCKLNTGATSYSSGSLPASFGSVTNTQDYQGSIYVTYTEAPSGPPLGMKRILGGGFI